MSSLCRPRTGTTLRILVLAQAALLCIGLSMYFSGRTESPTSQYQVAYHNYINFPPGEVEGGKEISAAPGFGGLLEQQDHSEPGGVARLSHAIIPAVPDRDDLWTNENNKMIRSLFHCMETGNCRPNQKKVVILGSYHFRGALVGWTGGEDMWCRSTVLALKDLGYTFLYALNADRAVQIYQMFPRLVKAVLWEVPEVYDCYADKENCVLSDRNPHGIPIWKIFSFHFWVHPDHPLGRLWTWSPEPYELEGHENPNTYLGYSVEPSCMSVPYIEPDERSDQGYVMAKRLHYFTPIPERAWENSYYEDAIKESGIELVIGANWLEGERRTELPRGVRNLGLLSQKKFLEEVSNSKVMIGVGQPWTSPTPYEALCLGVPFINPILSWDENNKTNRYAWSTQHGLLRHLDPPYVYNVHRDDHEGFVAAVKEAVANPIERHVLNRMRLPVIAERLHGLLEKDWEGEFRRLSR